MGLHIDALAGLRADEEHGPTAAAKRSGLEFIPYGIVMGPVATAIGALIAERWEGTTRAVVWASVTTLLSVGAVLLAKPGLVILRRLHQTSRGR